MSQKTLIVVVIILAVFGLALIGYFKAVPGTKNPTDNRPQIEITPRTFNFGEVEFGKIAEYTFKVKNLGSEVLEIKKVATSCACTTAKIIKDKIGPGEETELFVSYDTVAMGSGSHGKGNQERIIYVKNNDPINPQVEVMIYANVK